MTWYSYLRNVLEALYFLSGVALVGIAGFGLRQIGIGLQQLKLTKDIADSSSRRESVRLAAEQCHFFAKECVPLFDGLVTECTRLGIHCFSQPQHPQGPAFMLNDGDFVQVRYDTKTIAEAWPRIGELTVRYLNSAESFAIPFAAGVADDAIGFQETAATFCLGISHCMPAIYFLKQTQAVPFRSALTLFCIWNNRRTAQVVAPLVKGMQEFVDKTDKNKIKPL